MSRAILLAEDNEDDVFFFKNAAKRAGWTHEVVVARDGREAIDVLKRFASDEIGASRLSLVLLDLKMPFVGGLEVLKWMQQRPDLKFIPVVALSSSEQESDIEEAYRLGAASFLVKPSQPDAVGELVRLIDAYWMRHNRLPASRLNRSASRPALAS